MSLNTLQGACEGIRVLDISEDVSGDFCARLFSDYGADVIKIEPPTGAATRREGPFLRGHIDPEHSLLFWHLNAGKRSLTLNLDTQSGREYLDQLVERSDVLVHTGQLDCQRIRERHPKLITCSVTGFGESGPRAAWQGDELIYQAVGGSMYATGLPDREPLYGVGRRAGYMAGTYLYIGAQAALHARTQDGLGQHVEVSTVEAVASALMNFTTMYSYNGHIHTRAGSGNPLALLQCRDGWVILYLYSRWEELCRIIGADDLRTDPRFEKPKDRLANWPQARDALRPYFLELNCKEVVAAAQRERITLTQVLTPHDLLESEHLLGRGYWETVDTPAGPMLFLGPAFQLEHTPRRKLTTSPKLGEHTTTVLQELGADADALNCLTRLGVI